MSIKAIETHYKGYRFRSRLEARWAVFMDALRVKWEYEVEGYDLEGAGRYLPDFWLPDLGCWAEVKGEPAKMKSIAKLLALSEERPIHIFSGTFDEMGWKGAGTYWLGERTHTPWWWVQCEGCKTPFVLPIPSVLFPCILCNPMRYDDLIFKEGPVKEYQSTHEAIVTQAAYCLMPELMFSAEQIADAHSLERERERPGYQCDTPELYRAYNLAKAARFEFGESPDV